MLHSLPEDVLEHIISLLSICELKSCLWVRCLQKPAQAAAIKLVNHICIGYLTLTEVNAIIFLGGRVLTRKDRARFYIDRGSAPFFELGVVATSTDLVIYAAQNHGGWRLFIDRVMVLHNKTCAGTVKGIAVVAERRRQSEALFEKKHGRFECVPPASLQVAHWMDQHLLRLPKYSMRLPTGTNRNDIDLVGATWLGGEWIFHAYLLSRNHTKGTLVFARANPANISRSRLVVCHRKKFRGIPFLNRVFALPDDYSDPWGPECCNRCLWVGNGLICSTDRFTLMGVDAAIHLDSNTLFILPETRSTCISVCDLNTGATRNLWPLPMGFAAFSLRIYRSVLVVSGVHVDDIGDPMSFIAQIKDGLIGPWVPRPGKILSNFELKWIIGYPDDHGGNRRLRFQAELMFDSLSFTHSILRNAQ